MNCQLFRNLINKVKNPKKLFQDFWEVPVWSVFLVLLLTYGFIVNLFPPHFLDELIAECWYGKICKAIYESINSFIGMGWLTFALLLITGLYATYSLYKCGFRLLAFIVVALFGIWVGVDDYWGYSKFIWNSDYKWWIFSALACSALLPVVLWIKEPPESSRQSDNELSSEVNGFSTDESGIPDATSVDYAKAIVKKLQATDCTSSAYALGVASPWGTGKTKMLSQFKQSLPGVIILEYNPWMCLTEKSLVKDFFDKLANVVSEKVDSSLYSPIIKYGNAILAIEGLGSWFSTFKNYFKDSKESSLLERKKRIAEALKKAGKRIYIFIDDMDRLDAEEMFEILKLIRNTADFPNLIYVVAYDKGYLTSQLKNKGIENASQYIEKIFNIEINIPAKTTEILRKALEEELRVMFPNDAYLTDLPLNLIDGHLTNFRDVKRFARQFYINRMFMDENVGSDEYEVSDLFILELLRYDCQEVYDEIVNNITKIFGAVLPSNGIHVFSIKKEYEEQNASDLDGHIYLLKSLIQENIDSDNAFRYVSRCRRYFTFHLGEYEITKSEFLQWLEAPEEYAEGRLTDLIEKANDKRSLNFQFAITKIREFNLAYLRRYFTALLQLWFNPHRLHRIELNKILLNKLHSSENNLINTDEFFGVIYPCIAAHFATDFHRVSELCKSVRVNDMVLAERMRNLERENFNHFLNSRDVDAMDMIKHNSDLQVLYLNSMDWTSECYGVEEDGTEIMEKVGKTPLIDALCSYFEPRKKRRRQEFTDEFCSFEALGPDGEVYLDYLPDEMIDDEIKNVFGSNDNYKRFLDSAFLP